MLKVEDINDLKKLLKSKIKGSWKSTVQRISFAHSNHEEIEIILVGDDTDLELLELNTFEVEDILRDEAKYFINVDSILGTIYVKIWAI